MVNRLFFILIFSYLVTAVTAQPPSNRIAPVSFNDDWEFVKDIDTLQAVPMLSDRNRPIAWEKISLPHTPRIEPIEKTEEQWQGTCFYRKFFNVPAANKGKHLALRFDAAMHEADVYLNGTQVFRHVGGYLPFEIDLSRKAKFGAENCVLVKLNNQDNAAIPPGKPIKDLDFNYYGGLYRNAWLIVKEKIHISDAVQANREKGGGVLLHYENVSTNTARLVVQTDVQNDDDRSQPVQVKFILLDQQGNPIRSAVAPNQVIQSRQHGTFTGQMDIRAPKLWSPERPYLYQLTVQVLRKGQAADQVTIPTGMKTVRFEAGAFYLNSKKVNLRGTNRHQEYPYIGYALPDNAQYRDAWKIKEAGFNFVRCSHYPPSPSFLDACDELGILVMDSTPGWQFFGKEAFQQNSLQNIRDMIHRDRNHASIILWEASLNETGMSKEYMQQAHEIVHRELPYPDVYTCSWLEDSYDVFIPARQHAKAPDYWKKYDKAKPLLIAEYGDWEYYAQNAGFNQKEFQDLKSEERTSRQLRGFGEKRLLQQALNYQEAHNDNLQGMAVGDANWLMYDYKRGYAPDIESSGIMDIHRLPKFAYYFYQSQHDTGGGTPTQVGKPMVFIANYWNDPATKTVKVYSNCQEVELLVNGKPIARQHPDQDAFSTNLTHPPFTFAIHQFEPGTLTATGYIGGKEAVSQHQKTPGQAAALQLRVDCSGKDPQAGKPDVVFVYARVVDAQGTVIPDAQNGITFRVQGDAALIGDNPVKSEAGIATILLKTGGKPSQVSVSASASGLQEATLVIPVR